jgi:hypothetical protein
MTARPEPVLITVALCTYNHADRLERTLADLGNLATPTRPGEILLRKMLPDPLPLLVAQM